MRDIGSNEAQDGKKFVEPRPFADADVATRKLVSGCRTTPVALRLLPLCKGEAVSSAAEPRGCQTVGTLMGTLERRHSKNRS